MTANSLWTLNLLLLPHQTNVPHPHHHILKPRPIVTVLQDGEKRAKAWEELAAEKLLHKLNKLFLDPYLKLSTIHQIKLFLPNQFATLPHNSNQQLHKSILFILINQFFQCMNPLMDYQLHKQVGLPMQLNNLSPGSTQHNKTRSRWWSHSWWLPTNGCANVLLMKNSLIQKLEEHMVEYLECNSWYNGYVWEDSTWKLVMLSIFLFLFYNSPRRHLWNCEMLF